MSKQKDNSLLNNIIFVILIVLLMLGAYKSTPDLFSMNTTLSSNKKQSLKELPKIQEKEKFQETNVFNEVQKEHVRKKIDYGTAMEYFNRRQLSGTEIMELGKRPTTSDYFVRNSSKKIVFYPTTGSSSDMQNFMREFTKLRTSLKDKTNLVFIPIETGFGLSEKQIKNSADRVFYNLKKECGKFCVIDVPAQSIIMLKSPQIGAKTFEIAEILVNSL